MLSCSHIFYVKTLQVKIHKREWERESDIRIRKKFPGILRQLSMVSCPFQPFMGHSDDGENLLLINGFLFLTPDPAWSDLEQIKKKRNISVLPCRLGKIVMSILLKRCWWLSYLPITRFLGVTWSGCAFRWPSLTKEAVLNFYSLLIL